MTDSKHPPKTPKSDSQGHHDHDHDHDHDADERVGFSRRGFLGAAGVAAGAAVGLAGTALATDFDSKHHHRHAPRGRRILLKGGTVLTMDPTLGDFEKADVLIEGSKIKAIGRNIRAYAHVIDCKGMIVMPGFIDTHHHQYETIQRSVIADGLLAPPGGFGAPNGGWPQETYVSIVQNVWTAGRIGSAANPLWDLGHSPYNPEDCYISELVASIAGINDGVTTGIDTSQSSHTPEHTDAMIEGLMASGRRSLYTYAGGRSDDDRGGYEYPGDIGNTDSGLGRLRKQYFNSDDQLVTLGFSGGPDLWPLAREFGAQIVNHDFNGANLVANQDMVGPDMESIHAVNFTDEAWQVAADKGVHISIAGPIEMQMGHGIPPYQPALDHGILPSLSCDVDTNMAHDMFTLMRNAFTLQRMFINKRNADGELDVPPLLTCNQVLQMATVAGAAGAGLSHKVGMLRPGYEADIILLKARAINTWPMVNAPGTVVTMMDTSNVDTVFIGGKLKKWKGELVGVNVDKLLRAIERSQERVLSRIQSVPFPTDSLHEPPGYTPGLVGSCCLIELPYDATP